MNEPDPRKLYRVRPAPDDEAERAFGVWSSAEMFSAVFVRADCDRRDDPGRCCCRWSCWDPDCDVREVTTFATPGGRPGRHPRRAFCPSCRSEMRFDGYYREVALIPADVSVSAPASPWRSDP